MAHDEERATVRAQEPHQPLLGVDVEMVRGFVEHEVVGAPEENARELDAPSLATRQRVERDVGAVGRQPQPREDAMHVRFGAIAARVTECLFRVGEPADGAVARVVLHVAPEPFELVRLGVDATRRQHVRHRRVLGAAAIGARVLRQEAEHAGDLHPTAGDRTLAGERTEQGRLPRAVPPDEAHFVAGVHRECRVLEEDAVRHLDRQVGRVQHGARRYRSRRAGHRDIRPRGGRGIRRIAGCSELGESCRRPAQRTPINASAHVTRTVACCRRTCATNARARSGSRSCSS